MRSAQGKTGVKLPSLNRLPVVSSKHTVFGKPEQGGEAVYLPPPALVWVELRTGREWGRPLDHQQSENKYNVKENCKTDTLELTVPLRNN